MNASARVPRILAGAFCAALVTAALTALSGCGDLLFSSRKPGGTIETTNGLTARMVLPSGAPATNIKVFLLDEESWLANVKNGRSLYFDSAETNDSGTFNFKKFDSTHSANLFADVEGFACFIPKVSRTVLKDKWNNRINMAKKVGYMGNISDPAAQRIFLSGSSFSATVTAGHFEFRSVPQEAYTVVIERKLPDESLEYVLGSNVKLDQWQEGKPDTLVPQPKVFLPVEDFEDDLILNNMLTNTLSGGLWTVINDREFGGTTSISPSDASYGAWQTALTSAEGGTEHRRALHASYTTHNALTSPVYRDSKAGQDAPFAGVQMNIGKQNQHYKLLGMDSLTVAAGGNGELTVELVQQNPGTGVALQVVASQTFILGAWENLTVRPDSMRIHIGWFPENPETWGKELEEGGLPRYTAAPASWTEMGGMVTYIRFKGSKGTEFWLDDIRIYGRSLGEL